MKIDKIENFSRGRIVTASLSEDELRDICNALCVAYNTNPSFEETYLGCRCLCDMALFGKIAQDTIELLYKNIHNEKQINEE